MPAEDKNRTIQQQLVQRILHGTGRAPADLRAGAFDDVELAEPLSTMLDKVVNRSFQVADADFDSATEAGFTDDQLFELVICAAVGQSTRQYETGLAALAEATTEPGTE